jgi:hypothetical protein
MDDKTKFFYDVLNPKDGLKQKRITDFFGVRKVES